MLFRVRKNGLGLWEKTHINVFPRRLKAFSRDLYHHCIDKHNHDYVEYNRTYIIIYMGGRYIARFKNTLNIEKIWNVWSPFDQHGIILFQAEWSHAQ